LISGGDGDGNSLQLIPTLRSGDRLEMEQLYSGRGGNGDNNDCGWDKSRPLQTIGNLFKQVIADDDRLPMKARSQISTLRPKTSLLTALTNRGSSHTLISVLSVFLSLINNAGQCCLTRYFSHIS